MLHEQITDLMNRGDTEGAAKVAKVLKNVMMTNASIFRNTPAMNDARLDALMPARPRPYTNEERLAMRMGWGRIQDSAWAPGFEHVAIHHMRGSTTVHVWVISSDGQSHVIEDDGNLFPSDALVTKLNLLKG